MSAATETRRRAGTSSALTPLLDMLFLLLFALLASSRSRAAAAPAHEEIGIELPSVAGDAGADGTPSEPLDVVVDAAGVVTLAESPIASPAELGAALARIPGKASIDLRIDGDARHAVVADVLHAIHSAGVVSVRFVVQDGGPADARAPFGGGGR